MFISKGMQFTPEGWLPTLNFSLTHPSGALKSSGGPFWTVQIHPEYYAEIVIVFGG